MFSGVRENIVGNNANGPISKRVFQEKKARQISRKNEHFLPRDTHTYMCVSGGKKGSFFEKFDMLCFLKTSVLRFDLLPYYRRYVALKSIKLQTTQSLNSSVSGLSA